MEAFDELQNALEQLQTLHDQLHSQQAQHLDFLQQIEADRQSYQDLFADAPIAYLISSLDGTIRRANYAAAALLQLPERAMVGRSLTLFVPEGQRRLFSEQLRQARQADRAQTWQLHLQRWRGASFAATLTGAVARDTHRQPIAIRWMMQSIQESEQDGNLQSAVGED